MSTFDAAFPGTMFNESGLHIDRMPNGMWFVAEGKDCPYTEDAGGPTKWGVSQLGTKLNTGAPWTKERIQALTLADVFDYALRYYWGPLYPQILDQDVASKLFDVGFNDGPGTAVHILQRAVNQVLIPAVESDGLFGPATLAAVNSLGSKDLLAAFYEQQAAHYKAIQSDAATQKQWAVRALYLAPVEGGFRA